MKHFLVFLVFFTSIISTTLASAASYYVANNGADANTGTSTDTPWQTLTKVNATIFHPGDNILFRKGDTFYGSITMKNSGISGNPIVYDAYGTGANPSISGFMTLSNWTLLRGNIYYAPLDVPALNLVTVNGVIKGMGRYPNSGYLTYTGHTSNTAFSGTTVDSIPFDPTDGEVVIRKYRWILDRHPITSRSGDTIYYTSHSSGYGNNAAYSPLDGNGYFIQSNIGTLDQNGEWYYDKTNKHLYMYFDGTPADTIVKASSIDRNGTVNSQSHITFNNIGFTGGNTTGIYLVGANNITLNNCNFAQQGGNAIYGIDSSHITVEVGTISNALNNGIWIENNGSHIQVSNAKLSNIGVIAGTGRSGDSAQEGISINGKNTLIQNCNVTNTGYNAIRFDGDNAIIENNLVDSFCTIKDDGSGIYTYKSKNAIIRNNTVLNAVGAYAGSEWAYWEPFGKAAGIYLDNGTDSHNAQVYGNTLAYGEWGGIFINNNDGNQITNNTVYDFTYQLHFAIHDPGKIRRTVIKNNKFIAKTSAQAAIFFNQNSTESPSLFGDIDSNYYVRPIDDNATIWSTVSGLADAVITKRSLLEWQANSGQDVHSHASPETIADVNDLRFEYNAEAKSKTIPLPLGYMDVTGVTYKGSITLAPFTSVDLIKNPSAVPPIANAGSDQTIYLTHEPTVKLDGSKSTGDTLTLPQLHLIQKWSN